MPTDDTSLLVTTRHRAIIGAISGLLLIGTAGCSSSDPASDTAEPNSSEEAPSVEQDDAESDAPADDAELIATVALGEETFAITENFVCQQVDGDVIAVQAGTAEGPSIVVQNDDDFGDSLEFVSDDGTLWLSDGIPEGGIAFSAISTDGLLTGRGDVVAAGTDEVESVNVTVVCS